MCSVRFSPVIPSASWRHGGQSLCAGYLNGATWLQYFVQPIGTAGSFLLWGRRGCQEQRPQAVTRPWCIHSDLTSEGQLGGSPRSHTLRVRHRCSAAGGALRGGPQTSGGGWGVIGGAGVGPWGLWECSLTRPLLLRLLFLASLTHLLGRWSWVLHACILSAWTTVWLLLEGGSPTPHSRFLSLLFVCLFPVCTLRTCISELDSRLLLKLSPDASSLTRGRCRVSISVNER